MPTETKTLNCPRCGAAFDEDLGALSRVDDRTLVCPACGSLEAKEGPRGSGVHTRDAWIDPTGGTTRALPDEEPS